MKNAEKPNIFEGITIICREFDKYGHRKPATYVVTRNVTSRDLQFLSIRSRSNPELTYFATRVRGTDEEIIKRAKAEKYREPFFVKI